ncbi:MAG TPA: Hsp70 family protein [Stellaceae bacterium]|nr:Hsp70 family protein [Stellaceae bacterium]
MKLFQIEEPDGSPLEAADGPGAAVGIDVTGGTGRVAVALGGNAEILPDGDGARSLSAAVKQELLLGLRSRAEKQLARPVTHAVIAIDLGERAGIEDAAAAAGITVLRLVERAAAAALAKDAAPEEAPVLGAAIAAEDAAATLAPRP